MEAIEWLVTIVEVLFTLLVGGTAFVLVRLHTNLDDKVDQKQFEQHLKNDEQAHEIMKNKIDKVDVMVMRIDKRVYELHKNGKDKS